MLDEKYAKFASVIDVLGSLIDSGLSVSELYKECKNLLNNVPNICQYPGNSNIVKADIEKVKKDFELIVTDSDARMNGIMAAIVSKYGLLNETQLGDKIVEGINALDTLKVLTDIINGHVNGVQINNVNELVAYVNNLVSNVNAVNNNNLFISFNQLANENVMLKARVAQLEQQQR